MCLQCLQLIFAVGFEYFSHSNFEVAEVPRAVFYLKTLRYNLRDNSKKNLILSAIKTYSVELNSGRASS